MELSYIFAAVYVSCIVYVIMQESINASTFDGVYEVIAGNREMRAYVCTFDNMLYLRLTDFKPIGGFDEFPIGLAQFEITDSNAVYAETDNGVMIGDAQLFVDAGYTLQISKASGTLMMTQKYIGKDNGMKQETLTLKSVMNENNGKVEILESDQASKCWIPYYDKGSNIENVNENGKSIWRTDVLPGLNVYDMDILNDNGESRGCWGWTDQNGKAIEAKNVGSAGGDNYDYQYRFDGNLLIMQWDDRGSWISEKTKGCHYGSTLFMVVGDDAAAATFTCSDGHTGSQMLMHRQRSSEFRHLKCPLLTKDGHTEL